MLLALAITIPLIVVFGVASPSKQIDEPILVNKTAVQLRFFPDESTINLFHDTIKGDVTLKIKRQNVKTSESSDINVFDYSILDPLNPFFRVQTDDGVKFDYRKHFVTFWTNITDLDENAFQISIELNTNGNGILKLIGYLRPFEKTETNGIRNITLLDGSNKILGEMQIDYLIVRPMVMKVPESSSYISIDDIKYTGHRGTGKGIREDLPEKLIENTISAFNYVCSKKAQMIELDVQLSSDKIPIIYHDFEVKSYFLNRHDQNQKEMIGIPLKDMSQSVMKKISTNFMPKTDSNVTNEEQSFETLEEVLKKVQPTTCGIDVEIKYPSKMRDLTYESELGLELNEYVDRILEVLIKFGNDRPMFITSFQADLCTMIKLKQNKYHVAYLTSAEPIYYRDPRSHSIELGTAFVQSMAFKGLVPEVNAVLKGSNSKEYPYINYVKSRNVGLYLWGDKINSQTVINSLINSGADMVIFDHIDKILGE